VASPSCGPAWPLQVVGILFALAAAVAKTLQVLGPSPRGMVVVPTRQADMYNRLWCVYEIFFAAVKVGIRVDIAKTLIACGACTSEMARCSNEDDQQRLQAEIKEAGGFTCVDSAVLRERRESEFKIALGFASAFFLGVLGSVSSLMLLGVEPGAALGFCVGFVMVCVPGAIIIARVLIPMQGSLTKAQALRYGYLLPLAVCGVSSLSFAVLTETSRVRLCEAIMNADGSFQEVSNCQAFVAGLQIGTTLFSGCQIGGMVLVVRPVLLSPAWAQPQILQRAHLSATCSAMIIITIVVRHLGAWGQHFGKLLPCEDYIVVCFLLFSSMFIFYIYVPSMLSVFNVHIKKQCAGGAQDARLIRPKLGQRLVYFWSSRVDAWRNLPAMPPGLDGQAMPNELA